MRLANVFDMDPIAGNGWLYFIQAVNGGPVKIGRTTDPLQRLRILQAGNPAKLQIIAACPDEGHHEKDVHADLANARIGRSEWFVEEAVFQYLSRFGITDEQLAASGAVRASTDIVTRRTAA